MWTCIFSSKLVFPSPPTGQQQEFHIPVLPENWVGGMVAGFSYFIKISA